MTLLCQFFKCEEKSPECEKELGTAMEDSVFVENKKSEENGEESVVRTKRSREDDEGEGEGGAELVKRVKLDEPQTAAGHWEGMEMVHCL